MSPSAAEPDRLHLLVYDYVDDIVERRPPHREAHLDYAQRARDRGQLVMGGAVGDPPTQGVLVFRVDDASEIEAYAAEDPYVVNGLVKERRVVPWTVVV
jgi:uncharacterized protein YciI